MHLRSEYQSVKRKDEDQFRKRNRPTPFGVTRQAAVTRFSETPCQVPLFLYPGAADRNRCFQAIRRRSIAEKSPRLQESAPFRRTTRGRSSLAHDARRKDCADDVSVD